MTGFVADPPHAEQKTLLSRRNFLLGSAAAAGGLALYSGEIARHEISIVARDVALARLPGAFHGYRIAQISDIHFDEYTEPSFVRRVVAEVNRLAPDLVLLTGDYISNTPRGREFAYRRHAIAAPICCASSPARCASPSWAITTPSWARPPSAQACGRGWHPAAGQPTCRHRARGAAPLAMRHRTIP